MPYNHDKINKLGGGWYAVFKNGDVATEEEMPWSQLPNKKDIILVGLKRHNKYFELEGKEHYLPPGETHLRELSINPGQGIAMTKQTLMGWYIGYYEPDGKVIWRVDRETGKLTTEKVPYTEPE